MQFLVVISMIYSWISCLVEGTFRSGENFIRQPSMCVPIPEDLRLCHGIGYERMVLPNFLDHESLNEVRQQAASFVPMLRLKCHQHTKEFLCSLFAPVCLPEVAPDLGLIPPCNSLCKSVERSCGPIMKRHDFDWPSMLNCSQFSSREPCINFNDEPPSTGITPTPKHSRICAACGSPVDGGVLHENYCASEFVIKFKIRKMKVKKSRGLREMVVDRKRRIIYKEGPLSNKDLKRMKLILRGMKKCECPPLDNPPTSGRQAKKKKKGKKNKNYYLAMGRKVGKKLLVSVLHVWTKKNKVLRKASKTNFGGNECPNFGRKDLS